MALLVALRERLVILKRWSSSSVVLGVQVGFLLLGLDREELVTDARQVLAHNQMFPVIGGLCDVFLVVGVLVELALIFGRGCHLLDQSHRLIELVESALDNWLDADWQIDR